MPRYEFNCTSCSSTTQVQASVRDKQAGLSPQCGACGSTALRQSFGAVALLGSRMPSPVPAAGGGCCGGGGCGCG